MPSAPISASASSCWRALPLRCTTVSPLACVVDVLELAAEPQVDVGMLVDLGLQRRLQIGAMHHPIGRAGAKAAASPSGRRAISPPARALMMLIASGVTARAASRGCKSELDQDAAGIGRKLQAGAGFLQPLGLLQHDDAKALCRERQRGRQSPDPGTSDDDGARGATG